ncbi:MAG TPA: twin-arginine translocase TatA/TatE family subunit [Solirubrobacterales bacterium]|jgi:sec-independent protein translocase protein TatA|nr:twin-arginine translocase TatA/TatE family subunit [Solirubrobacterales bacterium]
MMGNIGPLEIGIVLIIALVVFGPKRLPDLGHSLGKGIREFKGSVTGESDEPPAQVAEARPVESVSTSASDRRPVTAHRIEDATPASSHH